MPEFVVTVEGFCQKKWLLHYGIWTILGVQNYPDKYALAKTVHLGGSSPLSLTPQWMAKPFWTTMVYHYGVYMGETVYSVEISWLFSDVPAHYIVIILSPYKQFNKLISP